jgi:NlpC/P60 family putative phage cell wall peptidase
MASRDEIVAAARAWIGTPYRHQGALKGVGCDCLGLLIGVWREVGGGDQPSRSALRLDEAGAVPPYTPDWAEAMGRETFVEGLREHLNEIDPSAAREGDLVLFRWRKHLPAKHAAIMTAHDRMVHSQQHAAVTEVPVSDWWRRRMAYAFELSHDLGCDPSPNPSPQGGGE